MAANFRQDSDSPINLGGQQLPPQMGTIVKWGGVVVGIILLFVVLSFMRGVYTDLLWFEHLGFRGVFVKILVARVLLFVIGAVIIAGVLATSLYFANRLSTGPINLPLPPEVMDVLRKAILWGTVAAVLILSVIFGMAVAQRWEIFLRFANSVPFGQTDPVFGREVSFYVFTLPVYTFLQGWLLGAAIVVLLSTLVLCFVNYSVRGVNFTLTPGLKLQISIIAAVLMLILGWGHWLDRWELLLSRDGAVFGAAYADINARKPALLIMTIIAVASGVLMLVNGYLRGLRLLVGAAALWLVMAVLLVFVWPLLMQRFTVTPNEFVKETLYIARNIEFTLRGFGMDKIFDQIYPAEPTLTAELVEDNIQTIDNIRLWDDRPLSSVYKQIQLIRPYYDFNAADVDRYRIGGEYRQVMLAAREVVSEKLDPQSQTWINMKLRYTHGFGIAMSPVTAFTPEGRPEFYAKDIPSDGVIKLKSTSPGSQPDFEITNPRIYYGEMTSDYVIVNTNTTELDYQAEGAEIKSNQYDGTGGVTLSSYLRRVAYAWQLGEINNLISAEITDVSRILYRREIQERISTVAPFLELDQDPYIVAAEGQLFWIQDAYTTSDRYPYSDPNDQGTNYIRNSVKITVDAFNGTLRFYVWDPSDPLVATYANIFPDLFLRGRSDMPESLRAHVRYPQDLFKIQADKYLKYHMGDPRDFYNLEDLWSIPNEKFGQTGTLQPVEPYYVIMKIPGETGVEFVLLTPMTRNVPPIMAGWLAARNDGERYGELLAFRFPKDRQIDSPEQIEAKIDNDPDISEWFTLRCQEGSLCIRGNLLVIPMASGDQASLLYAEPIYLQAEGVEFPELKRVILATQQKVVMEDSVPEAIEALTGVALLAGRPPAVVEVDPAEAPDEPVPPAGASLLRREIEDLTGALDGLKNNVSRLEAVLERLKELTRGE